MLAEARDGDQLRRGDVLVTTVTNVGWTPLFPRLGAVVTDVGAPLSHAAIVARELGSRPWSAAATRPCGCIPGTRSGSTARPARCEVLATERRGVTSMTRSVDAEEAGAVAARRVSWDLAAPVEQVAPELLGAVLRHGEVAVRLTEVEAYDGANDPASHAFRGRTPRNAVMFGPPGHLYVYFSYGMHWAANIICGPDGVASGVLLRAGEVIDGVEVARSRRGRATDRDLARGPGRLTQALGIRTSTEAYACSTAGPSGWSRGQTAGA